MHALQCEASLHGEATGVAVTEGSTAARSAGPERHSANAHCMRAQACSRRTLCESRQPLTGPAGQHSPARHASARLAKVPGLAVEVDSAAIDTVLCGRQRGQRGLRRLHRADHEVAHDVEAKAVHLRAARPVCTGGGHAVLQRCCKARRGHRLPDEPGKLCPRMAARCAARPASDAWGAGAGRASLARMCTVPQAAHARVPGRRALAGGAHAASRAAARGGRGHRGSHTGCSGSGALATTACDATGSSGRHSSRWSQAGAGGPAGGRRAWYARAQCTRSSTTRRSAMACSVAVLLQQAELQTSPASVRRW